MTVKTGSQNIDIPAYATVKIIGETNFSVFTVDSDGELESLLAVSADCEMLLHTKEKGVVAHIKIQDSAHWSPSITVNDPSDKVDPIPFEIPEELKKPETLEEKLQRFAAGMVAEMYGKDSEEMETFEDAMDFDIDDEANLPLSGYEVSDMKEDFVAESNVSEAETSVAETTEETVIQGDSEPSGDETA